MSGHEERMRKAMLIVLIALCGCTSVGEVVPTGRNSYLLTVEGCDGALLYGASCATTAIKAANSYCQRQGLVATVAHLNETQQWGTPQHGQVQFLCTDVEHQQESVLRPDKGIVTVQQK
jgi:hypothetical protein